MPYLMRFFDGSADPLSLRDLESALKQVNDSYRIELSEKSSGSFGHLFLGDDVYAELEVNVPGDEMFDEELDELLAELQEAENPNRPRVEQVLKDARRVIAIGVLWQAREVEPTLKVIDPIIDWLTRTRQGLLQADGDGYYEKGELVLVVE